MMQVTSIRRLVSSPIKSIMTDRFDRPNIEAAHSVGTKTQVPIGAHQALYDHDGAKVFVIIDAHGARMEDNFGVNAVMSETCIGGIRRLTEIDKLTLLCGMDAWRDTNHIQLSPINP
jgi:hypothetical protein